jgi:hypothetical protein
MEGTDMFESKEEKTIKKEMDMQRDYNEQSDESISRDMSQQGNLPSNISPQDFYEYKRFINLPDSQAEFATKIDKDVVFANLSGSKPSIDELRFQIGTIELFEGEFIEEVKIPRRDEAGNFVRDINGKIIVDYFKRFDEAFRSCLNFLKSEYKFAIVASRALGGNDRAAFLDISSNQRIQKEYNKKKDDGNKIFGTGGA